jgi:hypothetical protein
VPFRARILRFRPEPRNNKTPFLSGTSSSTRSVTVTGIPGSDGERRTSRTPVRIEEPHVKDTSRGIAKLSVCLTSVQAEAAVERRSRAKFGDKSRMNKSLFKPTLVDLVTWDLTIPERGKTIVGPPATIQRLERKVLSHTGWHGEVLTLLTSDKVVGLRNVNNTLSFVYRDQSRWTKAFCDNCRAFGPISRDRSFRFYLKLITFFGMSKDDLVCALRIRDLWLRGSKVYRKNIRNLIFKFPKMFRKYISSLPKKSSRRRKGF